MHEKKILEEPLDHNQFPAKLGLSRNYKRDDNSKVSLSSMFLWKLKFHARESLETSIEAKKKIGTLFDLYK